MIRHGDRSAMYGVAGLKQKLKLDCTLDSVPNQANTSLLQRYRNDMEAIWQDLKHGSPALMFGLYPKERTCMGAQLTGLGAVQHLQNGYVHKMAYIDMHGLLKHNFNTSQILVKSTPYSRTFQSAVAFLYGFLPKFDINQVKISTGDPPNFCLTGKNKVSSCNCTALEFYDNKSRKELKKKRRTSLMYKNLQSELSDLTGIAKEKIPWVSSYLDFLNGYVCHNHPLPCYGTGKCFAWPLIGKMWKFRDVYLTGLEADNLSHKKYSRLYMQPLLREIAKRMGRAAKRNDTFKFILYSGHDMTITPLTSALGFNYGTHPPFASRITFELYQHLPSENSVQDYFFRILFNGKDMTQNVTFCRERTNQDGLCSLEHFLQFVLYDNLKFFNANSYDEACRQNMDGQGQKSVKLRYIPRPLLRTRLKN